MYVYVDQTDPAPVTGPQSNPQMLSTKIQILDLEGVITQRDTGQSLSSFTRVITNIPNGLVYLEEFTYFGHTSHMSQACLRRLVTNTAHTHSIQKARSSVVTNCKTMDLPLEL